jgi:hypothetical protein
MCREITACRSQVLRAAAWLSISALFFYTEADQGTVRGGAVVPLQGRILLQEPQSLQLAPAAVKLMQTCRHQQC